MRWNLSEEQQAYQEAITGWLADAAPPAKLRGWRDSGDPTGFEEQFAAEGWLGVGVAEQAGGQGGDLVELALTAEQLAYAGAPSGAWLACMLAVPAFAARVDLVGQVFTGRTAALLVPAEVIPDEAASLTVTESGAVTGSVARVLAADRAAWLVAPVRPASGGLELRLIEADAPGAQVVSRRLLDRTRSVADVELDAVPSVGLEVPAAAALATAARWGAVLVAADALGAAARMLDLTVEYSKQRKQFGVPIASFQAVKHAAAQMLVTVEAARSIVYFAAASVAEGHPEAALHAAAAKAQVTADVAALADTALTVHGAIGYTWEHDLQLYYKRAKLNAHLCGGVGTWNERLAADLCLI